MAEFDPKWPLQQLQCPVCGWPDGDDDVAGDTAMAAEVTEHIRTLGDEDADHAALLEDLPSY